MSVRKCSPERPVVIGLVSRVHYTVTGIVEPRRAGCSRSPGGFADDDAPLPPRVILVNNFFEELNRLVPE